MVTPTVQRVLPLVYAILGLPTALMFAILAPPFQVPDEFEHFYYARALSEGQVFPIEIERGFGGYIRAGDQQFAQLFSGIPFKPEKKVDAHLYRMASEIQEGRLVPQPYLGAAIYPPTAYVAPALGLAAASLFGAGPLRAFYVGRIANAVVAVMLGAIAIAIVPLASSGFLFVLLLPMSLSQAGSFSPDAHLFGVEALLCAILAREGLESSKWGMWVAAVLVATAALAKAPMVAMAIPLYAIGSRRSARLAAALTGIVLAVFVCWTVFFVLGPASLRAAGIANVSPSEQLGWLFGNPLRILRVAWTTLSMQSVFYFQSMVGVFGWLDAMLPGWFYIAALLLFGAAAGGVMCDRPHPNRVAFGVASLVAAALTFGALYISWCPVGMAFVGGMQGRYFIPLLFPLGLAISGSLPCRLPRSLAAIPAVVLWAVTLIAVPAAFVSRYYLQG